MGYTQRITDKEIIQERALKTREKIMAAALELYTEKGYHRATVDEIAKKAGVSTGIAYRYFKNKKELLLAALTFAFEHLKEMVGISEEDFYNGGIEAVLVFFEKFHIEYRAFHEELEGLRHSDEDVRKLYLGVLENALTRLQAALPQENREKLHSREKLHIMIGLMENYCHTYMEGLLTKKELKYMRGKVIRIIQKELWEEM